MKKLLSRRAALRRLVAFAGVAGLPKELLSQRIVLQKLSSPVLFMGDENTAYRDPAAVYSEGWFYLYFTLVRKEEGKFYSYLAWSRSRDLLSWSAVKTLTPRDKNLEYGSPGCVVRQGNEWVLCLQTYPRPRNERYGNSDARLWTMRSQDLMTWSAPVLLRVKGDGVAREKMGRMIDPFLLADKDKPGKWWCLYKQDGISISQSYDLDHWQYVGKTKAGENPCVIVDGGEYVLFHSPSNGIGVKRSRDLQSWTDRTTIYLGQKQWSWAKGRVTAGFVLDLRTHPEVGKALMFFHGSRYKEEDSRGGFDNFASIGLAWSDDLEHWTWPQA